MQDNSKEGKMSQLDPKAKLKPDLKTHGPELDQVSAATTRTITTSSGLELDQASAAVARTVTTTTLAIYDALHRDQVEGLESLKVTLEKEEIRPEVIEVIERGWEPIFRTQADFLRYFVDRLRAKANLTDLDSIAARIPGEFKAMTQAQIIDQLVRVEKRIDRLEGILLTQKGITLARWQLWLAVILFVASVILNVCQALW